MAYDVRVRYIGYDPKTGETRFAVLKEPLPPAKTAESIERHLADVERAEAHRVAFRERAAEMRERGELRHVGPSELIAECRRRGLLRDEGSER